MAEAGSSEPLLDGSDLRETTGVWSSHRREVALGHPFDRVLGRDRPHEREPAGRQHAEGLADGSFGVDELVEHK